MLVAEGCHPDLLLRSWAVQSLQASGCLAEEESGWVFQEMPKYPAYIKKKKN